MHDKQETAADAVMVGMPIAERPAHIPAFPTYALGCNCWLV